MTAVFAVGNIVRVADHRLQTIRDMREAVCRMADSTFTDNDPRLTHVPTVPYELPDGNSSSEKLCVQQAHHAFALMYCIVVAGTLLEVGITRFKVPEVLMDPTPLVQLDVIPETQGDTYSHMSALEPIHRLVCDSILRCDTEVQSAMANNLIICGGGACVDGSTERIRNEVERLIHTASPVSRLQSLLLVPRVLSVAQHSAVEASMRGNRRHGE